MKKERTKQKAKLLLINAGEISPQFETALIRHLIKKFSSDQKNSQSILCVSSPTKAGISLGRFQVAPIALNLGACEEKGLNLYRRLTGGSATFYGKGIVTLSLILPYPSAFSDPIPPAKVINRYIRGILSGLQLLGLNAMYYGGDFLAVNKQRGGYLTMNMDHQGIILFQTVLAMDQDYTLQESISNYPPSLQRMHPPEPTNLYRELQRQLSREELIESIRKGYEMRFGISVEVKNPTKEEIKEASRLKILEGLQEIKDQTSQAEGLSGSALFEFSTGFFQAWVSLTEDKNLNRVRLTGDLVVDSPALIDLQNHLHGLPLNWEEIGRVVDKTLRDSRHFLMGFKSLKVIPDSILDAAKQFKTQKMEIKSKIQKDFP